MYLYINGAGIEMKEVWIQIKATEEERRQLRVVAKDRDLDMSKLIRKWIRNAYKTWEVKNETE